MGSFLVNPKPEPVIIRIPPGVSGFDLREFRITSGERGREIQRRRALATSDKERKRSGNRKGGYSRMKNELVEEIGE